MDDLEVVGMDCGDTRRIKELTINPDTIQVTAQLAVPGNGLELVLSSDDEQTENQLEQESVAAIGMIQTQEHDSGDSKGFW